MNRGRVLSKFDSGAEPSWPLAYVFVKDAEVKEWEAMNLEEATKASIKAYAHLMYHSMHNIDMIIAERVCLT